MDLPTVTALLYPLIVLMNWRGLQLHWRAFAVAWLAIALASTVHWRGAYLSQLLNVLSIMSYRMGRNPTLMLVPRSFKQWAVRAGGALRRNGCGCPHQRMIGCPRFDPSELRGKRQIACTARECDNTMLDWTVQSMCPQLELF
eukprot:3864476-Amphidinium_carterae.1